MSNTSLDTVATTLQNLKDIVERNHSQTIEPVQLVQSMERLIAEMKSKALEQKPQTKFAVESTVIALPNNTPIQVF